jgi:hypothetical protein
MSTWRSPSHGEASGTGNPPSNGIWVEILKVPDPHVPAMFPSFEFRDTNFISCDAECELEARSPFAVLPEGF